MDAEKKTCIQCQKAAATRSMRVSQPSATLHFCGPCYRMNVADRDHDGRCDGREARVKRRSEE